MTTILFERTRHAYLNYITSFRTYLLKYHPNVITFDSSEIGEYNPMNFDVVWRFMGFDVRGRGRYIVHDYASLSTGKMARLKNQIKRTINARPAMRVFLSDTVRRGFGFCDGVPDRLRDMGIDSDFFIRPTAMPTYDFVYAGSLNRGRIVTDILDRFTGPLQDANILLIGDTPACMRERYLNAPNIVFTGRVEFEDVPKMMAKARYGLNIMPDCYPFNIQTATKVLEYCAMGLRVVSTQYRWIDDFAQQRKAGFFWLDKDFSNMTLDNLKRFSFQTPPVEDLHWDNVISDSKMFNFL